MVAGIFAMWTKTKNTMILTAIAIATALATAYFGRFLSRSSFWILLLNLVGTALLACAFEPQEQRGSESRIRWLFNRRYASPVGFNKPEFYIGLICLAISSVIGALSR